MDSAVYLKFVFSLIFVLSILGLIGYALKKYGGFGPAMKPSDKRRIKIIEILPLEQRKKFVLVQKDGMEYLLLLGGQSDLLISSNPAAPIVEPADISRKSA